MKKMRIGEVDLAGVGFEEQMEQLRTRLSATWTVQFLSCVGWWQAKSVKFLDEA